MRRIVVAMAAASMLTSGAGVAAVATAAQHKAAPQALTCARIPNPVVNDVVQRVCAIFGP